MKLIRARLAERARLALIFEPRLRLGPRKVAVVALFIPSVLAMFPNLPAAAGVQVARLSPGCNAATVSRAGRPRYGIALPTVVNVAVVVKPLGIAGMPLGIPMLAVDAVHVPAIVIPPVTTNRPPEPSTAPGAVIKSGGRSSTAGRERFSFQRFLVVVQISVSLVLVVGALLFVGSFRNLMTLDPGFREQGMLLAFFDVSRMQLPEREIKTFQQQLIDEIRSIPQVQEAASTTNTVVGGGMWSHTIRIADAEGSSRFTWVSPGYLRTLEIPLLSGRDFTNNDTEASPRVAIVNQTFVRRFLGSADPIGKILRTSPEPNYPATDYQIIGVSKDTKYFDLRSDTPPMTYAPAAQFPAPGPELSLYIRSSAPLGILSSAIQRRLSKSHPEMTMEFSVFQKRIEAGLVRERLMAALSGFFGALAALLATIGIYGVIAYVVARRRNEIGIRLALGSTRPQVIGLVMKEAAVLVAVGLGIGLAGSLALARFAASLLFGLQARDPLTFFAAALLLAAVAALGSFLPARRASRVDPMTALRYE